MATDIRNVDVLIIGAGPAGLMAACWAAHYNISARIIDQKDGRTRAGHADGLQNRTLEILDSFGLADRVLQEGVLISEECYWAFNKHSGHIERLSRERSNSDGLRFGKVMLNQGAVEQVLLDYLDEKGHISVEWGKTAESIGFINEEKDIQGTDPGVTIGVRNSMNGSQSLETINARYVVACDGAHSWARSQLDVPVEGNSENSPWGVLDIAPITDFPDIRHSCAIQSETHGSIMTIPRENRLVRFYIYLRGDDEGITRSSEEGPQALVEIVQTAMKPYNLSFRYCDWWSLYQVRRQLVRSYRPHDRVFLAGDAAHTHSPMGGQGMNVSIQDSYNLMWKLGACIARTASPAILDTYHSERHPVARKLMELDSLLVSAYQEKSSNCDELGEVLREYAGFMSGIDVTYPPGMLVANEQGLTGDIAAKVRVGMRMPSFPLVYQCDGTPLNLAQALTSNGCWRLLVFVGDTRLEQISESLKCFADSFRIPYLEACQPTIEPLLIHGSPRAQINLLDLPVLFHPYDDTLGWDYWKVFADEGSHAQDWGLCKENSGERGSGVLILCRPDQHVAWVGNMESTSDLCEYISRMSDAT